MFYLSPAFSPRYARPGPDPHRGTRPEQCGGQSLSLWVRFSNSLMPEASPCQFFLALEHRQEQFPVVADVTLRKTVLEAQETNSQMLRIRQSFLLRSIFNGQSLTKLQARATPATFKVVQQLYFDYTNGIITLGAEYLAKDL